MGNRILFVLSGAFVGTVISSFLAPRLIHWYFQSPVAIVDCSPATQWAMMRLLYAQVVGAIVGAVIFSALIYWFIKRRSEKQNRLS